MRRLRLSGLGPKRYRHTRIVPDARVAHDLIQRNLTRAVSDELWHSDTEHMPQIDGSATRDTGGDTAVAVALCRALCIRPSGLP